MRDWLTAYWEMRSLFKRFRRDVEALRAALNNAEAEGKSIDFAERHFAQLLDRARIGLKEHIDRHLR